MGGCKVIEVKPTGKKVDKIYSDIYRPVMPGRDGLIGRVGITPLEKGEGGFEIYKIPYPPFGKGEAINPLMADSVKQTRALLYGHISACIAPIKWSMLLTQFSEN